MPETQIKELVLLSQDLLTKVQKPLEHFLNHYALPQLNITSNDEKNKENYSLKTQNLLSDLRHLLVACENTQNKLGIVNRSNTFKKEYAEHVLYETMHLCVNKFYYPEHEIFEEDGRNSYTGKDAIKFSFEPHPEIKETVLLISKHFEVLREELTYYETDYVTKKRLEGKML